VSDPFIFLFYFPYDPLGLALYAFDGTGNDKDDKSETPTHIAALWAMYAGEAQYINGVGTRTDKGFGNIGGKGAKERLKKMFVESERIYDNGNGDTDIDIIGFSRGAAMAREFANMIHDKYPKAKIRFLGLFDTVAQIGSPDRTNINPGIRLDIPPNVQYTAHAVARNEVRDLFPLTSIVDAYGGWELRYYASNIFYGPPLWPKKYKPEEYKEFIGPNYWEKPFDGVHSDIGGGFEDGTNLNALAWMILIGQKKGVPFSLDKLKGYDRLSEYDQAKEWHEPWDIDKKRTERTIYKGNLKP
jgi:hypothetical protein